MISKQKNKRTIKQQKPVRNKLKYPHITSDKKILNGVPIITGTRIAVRTIAGYYQMGLSADEILNSIPHLSAAQVHSALAFYFDHQKQIDSDINMNKVIYESIKK